MLKLKSWYITPEGDIGMYSEPEQDGIHVWLLSPDDYWLEHPDDLKEISGTNLQDVIHEKIHWLEQALSVVSPYTWYHNQLIREIDEWQSVLSGLDNYDD